jgi:hypothetical protein
VEVSAGLRAKRHPITKPVGYAAVGLGTISDIFMRACAQSQSAKITALVIRNPDGTVVLVDLHSDLKLDRVTTYVLASGDAVPAN